MWLILVIEGRWEDYNYISNLIFANIINHYIYRTPSHLKWKTIAVNPHSKYPLVDVHRHSTIPFVRHIPKHTLYPIRIRIVWRITWVPNVRCFTMVDKTTIHSIHRVHNLTRVRDNTVNGDVSYNPPIVRRIVEKHLYQHKRCNNNLIVAIVRM